jgi:(2Fe-2S) ferredoxin
MDRPLRYVWVCTKRRSEGHRKGSCAVKGSEELVRSLKAAAGKAGVGARVTSSGCFDLCWVGASVAVMPDGIFLKEITQSDIPALVSALGCGEARPDFAALSHKLVVDEDFIEPTAGEGAEPGSD